MARNGYISEGLAKRCQAEPVLVETTGSVKTDAPAAINTVLDEVKQRGAGRFGVEDLFQGRISVRSTVDDRVQIIVNEALESGLARYEIRHREAKGLIQGSVVASGILAEPHIIDRVTDASGAALYEVARAELDIGSSHLSMIQEGLRGVVRLPEGTAHSLDSRDFPIPVMGKTGTTSDFRDALFVGSTYGRQGITVAVRIGFDDNRSLGEMETGGRTALPIFRDVMLQVYGRQLVEPVPHFPREIEDRIDEYLARRAASRITPLAPLPELTPTQSGAGRQHVAASSSRTACGQAIQSASLLRCDQESSRVATGGRTPVEAVILASERTPQRLDMGSTASSSTSIATESR